MKNEEKDLLSVNIVPHNHKYAKSCLQYNIAHGFFNVNLKPYVAKNIKVDPSKQTEFNDAIAKIMNSKYNPIAPNLRESEGKTACDCGGK